MVIPALFCESIRAFSDEEGPYLRLAEWYEHRADPRGRFIRRSIDASRLELSLDTAGYSQTSRYQKIHSELVELQSEYESSWLDDWGLEPGEISWRWGVPYQLNVTSSRLRELGDSIFEQLPIVSLKVPNSEIDISMIIEALSRGIIRSLDLGGSALSADDIRQLLTSPHFVRLQSLSLQSTKLTDKNLKLLIAGRRFDNLIELDLANNLLEQQGAATIARFSEMPSLRSIDLSNNALRAWGLDALSHSTRFNSLTTLKLENIGLGGSGRIDTNRVIYSLGALRLLHVFLGKNDLREQHLHTIFSWPNIAYLHTLDLSNNPIGWRDSFAYSPVSYLQATLLHSLNLSGTGIDADFFMRLLNVECIPNLQALDLSNNQATLEASTADRIAHKKIRSTIKKLDWVNGGLDDLAMTALCRASWFDQLRHLNLAYNQIGHWGVCCIVENRCFSKIRSLDLSFNRLTDQTISSLLDSPGVMHLQSLNLAGNQLTDSVAEIIATSPNLPSLYALDVSANQLTDVALNTFTQAGLPCQFSACNRSREPSDQQFSAENRPPGRSCVQPTKLVFSN